MKKLQQVNLLKNLGERLKFGENTFGIITRSLISVQ